MRILFRIHNFNFTYPRFPQLFNPICSSTSLHGYNFSKRNFSSFSPPSSLKSQTVEHIPRTKHDKQRVVLLGTGWASFHFMKSLNTKLYDLYVVSPRNYFVFTPLLPSVCAGTLSPESCIDPVRENTRQNQIKFFEAKCTDINFNNQTIRCEGKPESQFTLEYDYLVIGVGATSNTFGIKGVYENAYFLKEMDHALAIRKKVIENFEKAALPGIPKEKLTQLLHFAIVGGGPTGVEVAAELNDFLHENLSEIYPELMQFAKITLIEMTNKLLPMFSEETSQLTKTTFQSKLGINTLLEHSVTEIDSQFLHIKKCSKDSINETFKLPYGFVLWASGVGQVDLSKKIISDLKLQSGNRVMKTNPQLFLKGTQNVYAMGDCSFLEPPSFEDAAAQIFKDSGKTHVEQEWISLQVQKWSEIYPQFGPLKWNPKTIPSNGPLNLSKFLEFAENVDKNYRPPSPTAQNAKKEGKYLASTFNTYVTPEEKRQAPLFVETWDGTLAYIGGNKAVGNLPYFNLKGGMFSLLFWKVVYITMQTSWRNQYICITDWIKTRLAGRISAKYQ